MNYSSSSSWVRRAYRGLGDINHAHQQNRHCSEAQDKRADPRWSLAGGCALLRMGRRGNRQNTG
jgi:hypothetical protein